MITARIPRWATRTEAMTYAKVGATTMNRLMHSRRLFAKKLGNKVLVDLNSVDDLIASLPNVGGEVAAQKPAPVQKAAFAKTPFERIC
ncbi:MAG: hypothetical protein ACXWKP_20820 [Bradyrhizobium sp.]